MADFFSQNILNLMQEGALKKFMEAFLPKAISFVWAVILALIVWWIGVKVIRFILKLIEKTMNRRKMEEGVIQFTTGVFKAVFYFFLICIILGLFGVTATSISAFIASLGVTAGLAVQGALSNLAGGVLILLLKPFKVGDYIIEDTHSNEGTVKEISIFYTKLVTIDNRTIVVPNGVLANSSLTNVTAADKRMMDIVIPVAYDADIKKAKAVLKGVAGRELVCFVAKEDRVPDTDIQVFVKELADSSVNLGIRFWLPTKNYWDVRFALLEDAKAALDEAGIEIPYNKLDVYVKSQT